MYDSLAKKLYQCIIKLTFIHPHPLGPCDFGQCKILCTYGWTPQLSTHSVELSLVGVVKQDKMVYQIWTDADSPISWFNCPVSNYFPHSTL